MKNSQEMRLRTLFNAAGKFQRLTDAASLPVGHSAAA